MDLTWLDPDRPEPRDVDAAVAVLEAARVLDTPFELPRTVSAYAAELRHGWDGERGASALVRCAAAPVAVLAVHLPRRDNTHLGAVEVTVDPLARRRGIGSRLLALGSERVRADGRRLVLVPCLDGTAGPAFLERRGFARATAEAQRRQDVARVDPAALDAALHAARSAADGYDLLRILDRVPDDLMPAMVELTGAINDAPTDELDIEDEVYDADRVRGIEDAARARGKRLYRLVARERATGVLAGHTLLAVDVEQPWHADQWDTSVLRAHRGHRLGLCLKASMLCWLREAEPQLRTIDTWNAVSNAHMVAVNDRLGQRVVATGSEWQRRLGPAPAATLGGVPAE